MSWTLSAQVFLDLIHGWMRQAYTYDNPLWIIADISLSIKVKKIFGVPDNWSILPCDLLPCDVSKIPEYPTNIPKFQLILIPTDFLKLSSYCCRRRLWQYIYDVIYILYTIYILGCCSFLSNTTCSLALSLEKFICCHEITILQNHYPAEITILPSGDVIWRWTAARTPLQRLNFLAFRLKTCEIFRLIPSVKWLHSQFSDSTFRFLNFQTPIFRLHFSIFFVFRRFLFCIYNLCSTLDFI